MLGVIVLRPLAPNASTGCLCWQEFSDNRGSAYLTLRSAEYALSRSTSEGRPDQKHSGRAKVSGTVAELPRAWSDRTVATHSNRSLANRSPFSQETEIPRPRDRPAKIVPGQPPGGRMPRHLEPQQLSPATTQDQKRKQGIKGQRRNDAQIDGSNRPGVISQKCRPGLRRRLRRSHQVFRDSRLGNFEPEHQKLAMDPGCAPQWVFPAHPLD